MSHARKEYSDFQALAPGVHQVVLALGGFAARAGIDKQLLALIKLRASQISNCAFRVQYHLLQAERLGVAADKLNLVPAWREAPQLSPRERAAPAWTEALTQLAGGVSDEAYEQARAEFSQEELAYLTSAVASITLWNGFGVAYRWTPPARHGRRRFVKFAKRRNEPWHSRRNGMRRCGLIGDPFHLPSSQGLPALSRSEKRCR
jgi:AhpD family alkylhydroperoxidase